jgi:predicted dienelactone hydrolase
MVNVVLKTAGIVLAVVLVGVATLIGLVRWEHGAEMTLPGPTGRFAVGRTSFTWTNDALTDDLAPAPGTRRTVFVWMWYPAVRSTSAATAPYLPTAWREAQTDSLGTLMREFLNRDTARIRTNSIADAAVSPEQPSYPVVIMRPGGGASTTEFTTLAEDLASHGYVVVGFDAPYRTGVVVFPDGRVVKRTAASNPETMRYDDARQLANKLLPMWTTDTAFVIDQLERLNVSDPSGRFAGRLATARLGIFGHSFGGATALQFCHDDRRCKAGVDIDGMPFGSVIREGAAQPFLFLLSDHGREAATAEGRQVIADIHSVYDHLRGARHVVMIRHANHFTFSDQMVVKSSYFIRGFLLVTRGPSALRGLEIARAYVRAFFDVYLNGAPVADLVKLRESYPEVLPFDTFPPDAAATPESAVPD